MLNKSRFCLHAIVISTLSLWLSVPAHAQVYKCVVNGKTQYAERPCAPTAQALDIRDDVSPERQKQARDVARREKKLRAGIEADELFDEAQRVREEGQIKANNKLKQGRCDSLVRTAKAAKDEAEIYYHQGLKDDAKRRQKEAEDAHFSECYGTVK